MSGPVYVLGGHQTDFARHVAREGGDLSSLLDEAVRGALEACRVAPEDVQTAHVGNFTGELFCRQGQLGGLVASLHPAFDGLPTARHEAACASGSVALLAAAAEIEAGRYDLACVVGVEQERHVDGQTAAEHLGVAAHTGGEATDARFVWPWLFDRLAAEYERRHGPLRREALVAWARTMLANARDNPLAQTRGWAVEEASFGEDDAVNPVVEGRLRKMDCGRITDGAAAVLLASGPWAARWAAAQGLALESIPRIAGWGHRTAAMRLEDKLARSRGEPWVLPQLRGALEDAWRRAGIRDASAVDVMEIHDCFTVTGYAIVDHLGLAPAGRADVPIEEGWLARGGRLPINPGGGLIGLGHPVGATGVRMLLDAARQLRGEAGPCQVEGARVAQTVNVGGSATTTVCFVLST